jgi:putative two-component system response regulator
MMNERACVLFVDDEQNVLNALRRLFMDQEIEVMTVTEPARGLEILERNHISVVVSDNLMAGMSGIEFLQRAKIIAPDTVRVMLTAHANVQSAMDAINKGEVLRYVVKPWNDEELKEVVANSIHGHRMVQTLKKADEYALYSLAQTIELKDPYTRGHCDRVAKYALDIAEALGLDAALRNDIRHGSWLHDCGKIGVPEAILNHSGRLLPEQTVVIEKHPIWGAEVARLAHLPEAVVNIILYHHERYDGKGYPIGIEGSRIPIEARVVSVADMYDALTSDRPYRRGVDRGRAIETLLSCRGSQLDPEFVDAFIKVLGDE